MTKKNLFLILFAVGLAVVYAVWFTGWFTPQTVQIFHTNRSLRPNLQRGGALPSLIFGINRQLKLTELRVVPLAGFQTNHDVLPLWHLVSDSNSVPVKAFFYGQTIRGMKPAIQGTHPASLEPNTTYRLFVVAGNVRGEHDFELGGQPSGAK
jgi:hypothetical protein